MKVEQIKNDRVVADANENITAKQLGRIL